MTVIGVVSVLAIFAQVHAMRHPGTVFSDALLILRKASRVLIPLLSS